jgi:hypothetical protein
LLVLLAAAIALVVRSLIGAARVAAIDPRNDTTVREDREAFEFHELQVRKQSLIHAIRGAQLDCETGKIAPADRDRLVARLEREAATVMRRIDALAGAADDATRAAADIEAATAAVRARIGEGDEGWSAVARARHATSSGGVS